MDFIQSEDELKEYNLQKIKLENKEITFGKYKNKTVKYIFDNDIEYVMCLIEQYNDPDMNHHNHTRYDDIIDYFQMCGDDF
tara:strand:- start:122 stop:364 length:243 start_codon:yes stop_codon:yes gene_type:complete